MKDVIDLIKELGLFFGFAGLVGGVIQSIRKPDSLKKMLGRIIVAAFIGWVAGSLLLYYLQLPEIVVMSMCSVLGAFAEPIMNEIEEFIGEITTIIKDKINKQ